MECLELDFDSHIYNGITMRERFHFPMQVQSVSKLLEQWLPLNNCNRSAPLSWIGRFSYCKLHNTVVDGSSSNRCLGILEPTSPLFSAESATALGFSVPVSEIYKEGRDIAKDNASDDRVILSRYPLLAHIPFIFKSS